MNDPTRLFVAAKVSEALQEELDVSLSKNVSGDNWRVIPAIDRHVTLYFIGQVPSASIAAIRSTIGRAVQNVQPFELRGCELAGMPEHLANMLWARFAPHPVHRAIHCALAEALGLSVDERDPFWPHITLARSKVPLAQAPQAIALGSVLAIDSLSLFASDPQASGARYSILDSWPLIGKGPADPAVEG